MRTGGISPAEALPSREYLPSLQYKYIMFHRRVVCGDYEYDIEIGSAYDLDHKCNCVVVEETESWLGDGRREPIKTRIYYVPL